MAADLQLAFENSAFGIEWCYKGPQSKREAAIKLA